VATAVGPAMLRNIAMRWTLKKRSAEHSARRKSAPYRSAMSMLNFYLNRAGSNLSPRRKSILFRAKGELRKVFHKTEK